MSAGTSEPHATSHQAARHAATMARVSYAASEPMLDVAEAIEQQHFVRPPHRMQRGDADAALATAPHRLSGELIIGGQEHFYLEGQVAHADLEARKRMQQRLPFLLPCLPRGLIALPVVAIRAVMTSC